jgi:hypothetical protein
MIVNRFKVSHNYVVIVSKVFPDFFDVPFNPFYLITAIYSGICFVTNLNFGKYSAIEIKLAQIAK